MTADLIKLTNGRKAAIGRDRQAAQEAIVERLLALHRTAMFCHSGYGSSFADGRLGPLILSMMESSSPGCIYVSVSERGERLFSATLNIAGKTAPGFRFGRRGWEALLFDEPWIQVPSQMTWAPARSKRSSRLWRKVEPLCSAAETAAGKNRDRAASVIDRRFREVLEAVTLSGEPRQLGELIQIRIGLQIVTLGHSPEGIYFRTDFNRQIAMTGYLDPRRPGAYAHGRFTVMSWKRGWEPRLFEQAGSSHGSTQVLPFGPPDAAN